MAVSPPQTAVIQASVALLASRDSALSAADLRVTGLRDSVTNLSRCVDSLVAVTQAAPIKVDFAGPLEVKDSGWDIAGVIGVPIVIVLLTAWASMKAASKGAKEGGQLAADAALRMLAIQFQAEEDRLARADRRVARSLSWRMGTEIHLLLVDLHDLSGFLENNYRHHPQRELDSLRSRLDTLRSLQTEMGAFRDEVLETEISDWLYDLELQVKWTSDANLGEINVTAPGVERPPPRPERAEHRRCFMNLHNRGDSVFLKLKNVREPRE